MSWLNQLKLSRRLALGFGFVIALCVVIVVVALGRIAVIGESVRSLSGNTVPSLTALGDMRASLTAARRAELRYALVNNDKLRAEISADRVAAFKRFEEQRDYYEKNLLSDDEDRRLITDLGIKAAEYRRLSDAAQRAMHEAFGAGIADVVADARTDLATGQVFAAVNAAAQLVDQDWEYNVKLTRRDSDNAAASETSARVTLIVAAVVAVTIGVIATILITRSIVTPLRASVEAANRVAHGDLTMRLEVSGNDELAELTHAQQAMISRLGELIGQLKQASQQIETGAGEVAAGSIDLSSRTEEQAASLEESSASLEQLTGTVKQNAEHATQVMQLAEEASGVAARGGSAVREVVSVMQEIETASRQVEAIVGVIDGISFQTNILALNAAVEAARAGEQGRGFAVVAAEVRTLAQRSAQAAKEIKELIGTAADKVGEGSQRVNVAGATIDDVVSRVEKVGGLIREIGSATREQTAGIEQVNQAVSQLDGVTQQNAALVEQSTAAADSLKAQARQLAEAVGRFRV